MQASAEQGRARGRGAAGRESGGHAVDPRVEKAYRFADLSSYSLKDRLLIRAADVVFYVLIRLIGRTVRFEVEGWGNWEEAARGGRVPIYTFWHNRVFLSTYFWRRRGIVVMTSRSFDGEYIARFIQRFGYGASRGSSTRGGVGALVEMVRLMRAGRPAAFTIDGPRGPRYVAKTGAVLLAKKTGQPILPFTITAARRWEAKSWDRFQVPKPFTRARVIIAPPVFVPADADEEATRAARDELQRSLDEINRRGREWRASLS
ncbi:MAG TPA: lysophospholipid acyltransferase family protein [Pyrinomonadaceae bacterium]